MLLALHDSLSEDLLLEDATVEQTRLGPDLTQYGVPSVHRTLCLNIKAVRAAILWRRVLATAKIKAERQQSNRKSHIPMNILSGKGPSR